MPDRDLLERHLPRLRYDAQDACRAVAAATMCDNPPNRLRRHDRQVVAAPPELSLDALPAFPFRPGDHLAAGPDAVADAVRMQATCPHAAYGRVVDDEGLTWLQYWLWYYDNPKTFLGKGRHQGDWELVQIGLEGGVPRWVTYSQHGLGETRPWEEVERDGDRPVVYVAPFSHANYFQPGTRYYFPAADHPTDRGPAAVPELLPFGTWAAWRGRWGADTGARLLGLRLPALGGVSPSAPVVQRERWQTPATYARKARRPATNALKVLLWRIGRATYPLAPAIETAVADGRRVTVRLKLHRRPWRRVRHLLVTVHRDEPWQPMVASSVVRASRQVDVDLPEPVPAAAVWVSAFNVLGQRSDATTAFTRGRAVS